MHFGPGGPARAPQGVGVRGELHDLCGLRVPGELGVVDLVPAFGIPHEEIGAAREVAVVEHGLVDHGRPGAERLGGFPRGDHRVPFVDLDDDALLTPQPRQCGDFVRPPMLDRELICSAARAGRTRQPGGESLLQNAAVFVFQQVGEIGRGVHRRAVSHAWAARDGRDTLLERGGEVTQAGEVVSERGPFGIGEHNFARARQELACACRIPDPDGEFGPVGQGFHQIGWRRGLCSGSARCRACERPARGCRASPPTTTALRSEAARRFGAGSLSAGSAFAAKTLIQFPPGSMTVKPTLPGP